MSRGADPSVSAVHALMLHKFRTEPFHNLHLMEGRMSLPSVAGGTCSDKTLSFLDAARLAGFDAALHTGFIGGREIHRLARLQLGGRTYFADVGNGWPSLELYPADRETSYRCFGMRFRTELYGHWVRVFHLRGGKDSLQLEIDIRGKPEREINADIADRFSTGIVYPFSHSLRFSLVVGDRFLFLRGNRLEIYSDTCFEVVDGIQLSRAPAVIREYFQFDSDAWSAHPATGA